MSENILIEKIRRDGGTQSRVQIDESTILDYVETIGQGGTFPPITLYYDGESYWLADGFHRVEAHRRAEKAEIQADVKQGTRREAVLHSVGANASHGLRRTTDDKRRAILTLLEDEEWSKWSDREISNRVGVSPSTVGKYRAEISSVQDGQIERTVSRNGTTYTMKTSNIGEKIEKPLTLAELHNQDRKKFQGDYEDNYLLVYTYRENFNSRYLCIASDATRAYIRSKAKIESHTITIGNEKLPIAKLKVADYQTMLESMTGCFVRFEESSLYESLWGEVPSVRTQQIKQHAAPDKKPAPKPNTPTDTAKQDESPEIVYGEGERVYLIANPDKQGTIRYIKTDQPKPYGIYLHDSGSTHYYGTDEIAPLPTDDSVTSPVVTLSTDEGESKPIEEGDTVLTRIGRVGHVESVTGQIANVSTVNGVQPHKVDTLTPVPANPIVETFFHILENNQQAIIEAIANDPKLADMVKALSESLEYA